FQTLVVTDTIPQNPDATVIVTAQRWFWSFNVTYPNGSYSGPQSGAFTVKVGQVVKLLFQSVDVAHSFSVSAYGLKIDVIPGHTNVYWFKALVVGAEPVGSNVKPNWFIDYNGNNQTDPDENKSQDFSGPGPALFTFVPTREGSATYKCQYHSGTMFGTIRIVAQTNVTLYADAGS